MTMSRDPDSDDPVPVRIGPDGFAMLGLSGAIMLLSLGTSFLLALAYVLRIAFRTPSDQSSPHRIIVLGMRLNGSGGLDPGYQARLERALALWRQSELARIVILGGVTTHGFSSEATAGAACLLEKDVRRDAIETEDRSRHTLENLLLYRERYPPGQAELTVLVTSRFHMARSSLLAVGLGIAHRRCAAEARRSAALRYLPHMLFEALLIHWYITGRSFARITSNQRMTDRIT
jgi:uncharacterized SAM-binding protein YcdF (DUF218 family)